MLQLTNTQRTTGIIKYQTPYNVNSHDQITDLYIVYTKKINTEFSTLKRNLSYVYNRCFEKAALKKQTVKKYATVPKGSMDSVSLLLFVRSVLCFRAKEEPIISH